MIALAPLAAAAQLLSADVSVTVGADGAAVDARFEWRADRMVRMSVMRLGPGVPDSVEVEGAAGVAVTHEPGLTWISVTGNEEPATVHLRYVVRGAGDRVPLPVPDVAARPAFKSVGIRLAGAAVDGRSRFPRFTGGGVLSARLDNVPAFIRLPTRAFWFAERAIQVVVAATVVFGSAAWLRSGRRRGWAG
jgi:hypothetical protein